MNEIKTASGKFYSGMTKETAQKRNLYKSTFRRDFRNIDKNGDGILSKEEILYERISEAGRKKVYGFFNFGFGVVALSAILFLGKKGETLSEKMLDIVDIMLDAPLIIIGLKQLMDCKRIKKENEKIKQQLNKIV